MNEQKWISWKINTSKNWDDMKDVLKMINIDFIDYDHRILVEGAIKLNIYLQELDKEYSLELLNDIKSLLGHLYDYAVKHFHREELFMQKYELPDIDKHKMEHKRILGMIKSSIDDYNKGKVTVSHDLKMKITDWLIQHINKVDFNYFDLENWSRNLVDAEDWDQISDIISLIGITEIDKQHKQLTEKAIEIFKTIDQNTAISDIDNLFNEFYDIVMYHFSYEKDFMTKYNIPGKSDHLLQHTYFVERINLFPREISEDPSAIEELKVWLLTWWINHINVTDTNTFAPEHWLGNVLEKAVNINEMSELLRLTHIQTIDHDHLDVMKYTFELNELIKDGKEGSNSKKKITIALELLYDKAKQHFSREEKIMKEYGFDDYSSHLTEHGNVLLKLKTIMKNYQEDRLYATENIKTMILDWWINHTNTVDYRTFVINPEPDLLAKIRKEERNA